MTRAFIAAVVVTQHCWLVLCHSDTLRLYYIKTRRRDNKAIQFESRFAFVGSNKGFPFVFVINGLNRENNARSCDGNGRGNGRFKLNFG